METNKVPTSTSATVSATSAVINPLFDPVALQTAYFAAAQLHSQLQQNSHLITAANTTALSTSTITTTTANNIHAALHKTGTQSPPLSACLSSFTDNDRLYSLLPLQLQSCLKQKQRNFLQQQQSINTSLAHHFSAFSPINTDLCGGAVTSTTSSLFTQPSSLPSIPPVPPVASSQQPLDFLLMQMQMATAAAAAAAGFFPATFNVLPPVTAAALGLLTPQFRMLQLADSNFPTYTASANANDIFASDTINKNAGDTSTIERSLLQAQINLLANGSSLSSIAKEHTCTNNTISDMLPNGIASSLAQQLNSSSNHNSSSHHNNNGSKQQRIQMKRPYDEMSILRSLCNENHIAEQETEMICEKRSRLGIADESGQRNLQKSMKACNSEKNQQQQQQEYLTELNNKDLSDESSKTSKENNEKCVASDLFDENSPDRHHPLNHRPPAMEARFLECMAAIALHSNIPLPMKDEDMIRNTNINGNRSKEIDINKSDKHKQSIENIELANSSRIELGNILLSNRSKSCENISVTTSNENENKKCWPNSAIDEELCKELENYKDSDVPMIHALVLPAKLSDSASSLISDKKYSQNLPCTMVPESLAVPVPILNTLLDRILQTMLDS